MSDQMKTIHIPLYCLFAFLLSACTMFHLTAPDNDADNPLENSAAQTDSEIIQESVPNDEVIFLLRPLDENRIDIVGTDAECFDNPKNCELKMIIHLPKDMPQIQKIFWLSDGIHALFWDSDSGKIYRLNRLNGEIQLVKEKVWKTQNDFFISSDGTSVLYDLQRKELENAIVLMDVNSGNANTLDINVGGMKRIAQWVDQDKFLFWTEISSGQKGYLEDIKVYTYDIRTRKLETVEIGMDWMNTSPPYYSPDKKTFVISKINSILFFDKDNKTIKTVDINKETYLWSPDSTMLAVYTQGKKVLILHTEDDKEKQVFTVPEDSVLSDWLWLPGTDSLLLVINKMSDGRTSLISYSLLDDSLTTIEWPILEKENVISLSYKPIPR
jgi:hypothetical protein